MPVQLTVSEHDVEEADEARHAAEEALATVVAWFLVNDYRTDEIHAVVDAGIKRAQAGHGGVGKG